jgi:hypothetical protein
MQLIITNSLVILRMAEIGIVEYFIMGEAVGIVATLFVGFYYSRKQMQKLSVDIETKVLNDLDDKLHGVAEMAMSEPELAEILDRDAAKWGPKVAFAMNILRIYSFAFQMYQRKALRDNEWNGWLRQIRASFKEGSLGDYWKIVEPHKWFDVEFQNFIDNEIIGRDKVTS